MTWDKQNTTKLDVLKVYEEPCVRASWADNFLFLGQAPLILSILNYMLVTLSKYCGWFPMNSFH